MHPVGFEPTISAGERPQTYALDRAANGTSDLYLYLKEIIVFYTSNDTSDLYGVILLLVLNIRHDLTLRLLMSYIYGAPILDVSRSHTTTQHIR